MSQNVLIYGAGAIGRGFLAPVLHEHDIKISFVDNDKDLVNELKKRKSYKVAITDSCGYEIVDVPVSNTFLLGEESQIEKYSVVFSCVGPKNCYDLAVRFKDARAVISCENDMATVDGLRELSGNKHIYFGIPDVITSNTASPELLNQDSLMTVTEQGVLVLEKGSYALPNEIIQVDEQDLYTHWICKLFIHNAPHAILAYLGWLGGYTYIHEAMADKDIRKVVVGSISEIKDGVVAAGYVGNGFANSYKDKEITRFSNKLLYDTIRRVAREPLRKIANDNRLVLGLRIALFNGVLPVNTAKGLKAALYYDNKEDEESVYLQNIRLTAEDSEVLSKFSGIDVFDPMNNFILEQDLPIFTNN